MASRFEFRRIHSDSMGYYYDRWDRAIPISVIADTEVEAREKAATISGDPPQGEVWKFHLDRIAEEPDR